MPFESGTARGRSLARRESRRRRTTRVPQLVPISQVPTRRRERVAVPTRVVARTERAVPQARRQARRQAGRRAARRNLRELRRRVRQAPSVRRIPSRTTGVRVPELESLSAIRRRQRGIRRFGREWRRVETPAGGVSYVPRHMLPTRGGVRPLVPVRELRREPQRVATGRARPGPKRGPVEQAGLGLEKVFRPGGAVFPYGSPSLKAARLARVPQETVRAYVEALSEGSIEPIEADVRFAGEAVAGVVTSPYMLAKHGPKKILDEVRKDYERTYGSALRGDWATFRAERKKGGGLRIAVDVAPVGAAALKAGGAVAKTGLVGPGARTRMTAPRPVRRISPGEIRRQRAETAKLAPNPLRVLTQQRRDIKRERVAAKRDRAARARAFEQQAEGAVAGTRRLTQPAKPKINVRREAQIGNMVARLGGRISRDRQGRPRSVLFPAEKDRAMGRRAREQVDRLMASRRFEKHRHANGDVEYFPVREVVGQLQKRERFAQRRLVARPKGQAVERIRMATADEQHQFAQALRAGGGRIVGGLNRHQRAALFYGHTGRTALDDPELARRHLSEMEQKIKAERKGAKYSRFEHKELRKIERLREHADEIYTPQFRQAVEMLRGQVRRVEAETNVMPQAQRIRARYGPQAQQLGLAEERVPIERFDVRASAKALERRQRRGERRERLPVAIPEEPPQPRPQRVRVHRREGSYEGVVTDMKLNKRGAWQMTVRIRDGQTKVLTQRQVDSGDIGVEMLGPVPESRQVEGRLGLEAGPGPAGPVRREPDIAVLGERADPSLVREGRGLVERPVERAEGAAAFARRTREAAQATGRETPSFAPSERFFEPKFHLYAAGGTRAPAVTHQRQYILQRRGEQRTDPQIIYEGVQRNVKTRITRDLIVDTLGRSAHPGFTGTLHGLRVALQREGIDFGDVAIWFPGKFREAHRGRAAEVEAARPTGERYTEDLIQPDQLSVADQLTESLVAPDSPGELAKLAADPRFEGQQGFVVPRAMYDEIMGSTKGQGKVERILERIKTVQSRMLLGTFNVPWVIADTITNTGMAMLLGGVSPARIVRANVWVRRLPKDVRDNLMVEIGVGSARSQVHRPRLGAAVNNRWVNGYRAWKENTPLGRNLRPISGSIDLFLKAEKAIANDPQRAAVFHRLLEQEAIRRVDRSLGKLNGLLARLPLLKTTGHAAAQREMVRLVRNRRMVEEIGRGVDEVLGDWTTLTNAERRGVNRFVMFYPYMRYSLRLAFMTLPLNHPIRLSLVTNLAGISLREQMELLGADGGDAKLMAGRFFYRDSQGNMREINAQNLSPIGNTFIDLLTIRGAESIELLNAPPPVFSLLLGQVMKRNIFRDRYWRVHGEAGNPVKPPELGDNFLESLLTRGRVALNELARLPIPTRLLSKWLLPGEQGDDSVFFSPRPTEFKSQERIEQAEEKRERETVPGGRFTLQELLRPLVSRPSDIENVLERRRQARGEERGGGRSPFGRRATRALERAAGASSSGFDARTIEALERAAGR